MNGRSNKGQNQPGDRGKSALRKYKSATHYTLAALIPYTEANLNLSFRPNSFFDDLQKFGVKKQQNTEKTLW